MLYERPGKRRLFPQYAFAAAGVTLAVLGSFIGTREHSDLLLGVKRPVCPHCGDTTCL